MEPFVFHVERTGEIIDGYHTFDELYKHRTVLFAPPYDGHTPNDVERLLTL